MKTKLKHRIISAALALSMVTSLLPAGIISVYAADPITDTPSTPCTITKNADKTFDVTFTIPGAGGDEASEKGNEIGNYAFILIPDVSTLGQDNAPSNQIGKSIRDTVGSSLTSTAITNLGGPSPMGYGHKANTVGVKEYYTKAENKTDGYVTFSKVTLPDWQTTWNTLKDYTRADGKLVREKATDIPLVAIFWTDAPVLAYTKATWSAGGLLISPDPIKVSYKDDGTFSTDNSDPAPGVWTDVEGDFEGGFAYVYYTLTNGTGGDVTLTEALLEANYTTAKGEEITGNDGVVAIAGIAIVDESTLMAEEGIEVADYTIYADSEDGPTSAILRVAYPGGLLLDPDGRPLGGATITVNYKDASGTLHEGETTAGLIFSTSTSSWETTDITFDVTEGYSNVSKIVPVIFTTDGDAAEFVPSNASFADSSGNLTVGGNKPTIKWYRDADGTDEITESNSATLAANSSTTIYLKVTLPDGLLKSVTYAPGTGPLVRVAGPAPEAEVGINVNFTGADRYTIKGQAGRGGKVEIKDVATTSQDPKRTETTTAINTPVQLDNLLADDHVQLTATEDKGYDFKDWTVGDSTVSSDNPYTVTGSANGNDPEAPIIYTAGFVLHTPVISTTQDVTTAGGSDGEISITDFATEYPTGNDSPLTFVLKDKDGNPVTTASFNNTTGVFSGVKAGKDYTVTVSDGTLNATSNKTPVNEPGAATVTVTLDGQAAAVTVTATNAANASDKISVNTHTGGVYKFDTLKVGATYNITLTDATGSTWVMNTGTHQISSGNNLEMKFYTIYTEAGTGAKFANLGTTASKATDKGVYEENARFKVVASSATGYSGQATWESGRPTDGSDVGGDNPCTTPGQTNDGVASGDIPVTGTTLLTATFEPDEINLPDYENKTYTYGQADIGLNLGAANSYEDDTPTYSISFSNQPKWLSYTANGDGGFILHGRPNLVDKTGFTVTVTATSDNGETDSKTFTIKVNPATPTLSGTAKTGTGVKHYEGEDSDKAMTVTLTNSPYYNGDPTQDYVPGKWVDVLAATDVTIKYEPTTLPADGNVDLSVVDGTYNDGTKKFSEVWIMPTDTVHVPISTSWDVTVNVRLNNSVDPTLHPRAVVTIVSDGVTKTAPLSGGTVTIQNVPSGTNSTITVAGTGETGSDSTDYVWTGDIDKALTGNNAVNFDYYTLKLSAGDNGTITVTQPVAATGAGTQVNGPYRKDSSIAVTATGNSGYKHTKWVLDSSSDDAAAASAAVPTTLTAATALRAYFTPNIVTVTIKQDNQPDNTRAGQVTLVNKADNTKTYNAGNAATTGVAVNVSAGVATFTALPEGTYKILVDGAETNHEVVVNPGSKANEDLDYYTVHIVQPVDAGNQTITTGTTHTAAIGGGSSVVLLLNGVATVGAKNTKAAAVTSNVDDPNYDFTSWGVAPASGSVSDTSSGNDRSGTFTLTSKNTSATAAEATHVKVTPKYTKNRFSLTVTVTLNKDPSKDKTVTLKSTGAAVDQTPLTNNSGQMTITGLTNGVTYTLGVKDGTKTWDGTYTHKVSGADDNIDLDYVSYDFTKTAPAGASGGTLTEANVPGDETVIKKGGSTITTAFPTLGYDGYKFDGWATASGGSVVWPSGDTYSLASATTKTTFYPHWTVNKVIITATLNKTTAKAGSTVTLYKGTTATDFIGTTAANGTITFEGVTAGDYNIYDDKGDTGVDVTAEDGKEKPAELRYYQVEYLPVDPNTDHGKYGSDNTLPDSVEILVNGDIPSRRTVTLPPITAETNFIKGTWTLTPAGMDASGAGTAPEGSASTWTANGSYTGNSKITLKPNFTKNKATIEVTVTRNGQTLNGTGVLAEKEVTLAAVGTKKTTVNGVASFENLGAATYTATVADWINEPVTAAGNTKDIDNDFKDGTIALKYFDYTFEPNIPDTAKKLDGSDATASGMPTNPGKPVLNTYTLGYPAEPVLTGYTFKGWSEDPNADNTKTYWKSGNKSITKETTYYAIWQPVTMSLGNMTGHGGMTVDGIINFTTTTGTGGGGTTATDYTYSIVGAASKDGVGVRVKDDGTGFEIDPDNKTPDLKTTGLKEDKTYDIVFNVKAVSKLNQQEATATITITVEPTYKVVYDLSEPVAGTDAIPKDPPTDNKTYVATGSGMGEGNQINVDVTPYSWPGDTFTFGGWSLSDDDDLAGADRIFDVSTAVTAQGVDPGGNITLYAVWTGKEYQVSNRTLTAVYHQGVTNADGSDSPDWIKNGGLNLDAAVINGGGPEYMTFTVLDDSLPDFLEIVQKADKTHVLKLRDNERIGDVAVYTIKLNATSSSASQTKPMTVTLTVSKAMPIIEQLEILNRTHYAGDPTLGEMTYVHVRDPYVTAAEETAGTYTRVLTTGTTSATESNGSWAANPAALATSTTSYKFTYTPADTNNYQSPAEDKTISVVTRTIALMTRDDRQKVAGTDNAWAKDFTNGISQSFTAGAGDNSDWETIKVNIQNPATTNSKVDTITATPDAGNDTGTGGAFRNPTLETVTDLATGTDALILTFQVRTKGASNGTHTLKYTFTGNAGPDTSAASASATYTFTLEVGSSSLSKVVPQLQMVESTTGHDGLFAKSYNPTSLATAVDVTPPQGGLHLTFPAIGQEEEGAVKEYVITLTGPGGYTKKVTLGTDKKAADGNYYFWWPVDGYGVNDLNPTQEYTVTVQAVAQGGNYTNSTSDPVKEHPGRKLLTIDMITENLTDMTFNGTPRSSSSKFGAPTGIDASTIQVTYSDNISDDKASGDNREPTKLHVNMTETTTDPALTSDTLDHDYYVWVHVPQSTYYLALGEVAAPVAYNTRTVAKDTTKKDGTRSTRTSPHENWEIVQAQATMTLAKSSFTGLTETEYDIRPNPTVKYTVGAGGGAAYNNGVITAYYDIVYTLSAPGSAQDGKTFTDADLEKFKADKDVTYTFTAKATYKTADFPDGMTQAQYTQFMADVSEPNQPTFTFGSTARKVTKVILDKWDAVNGVVGACGTVLKPDRATPDTKVTYGDAVGTKNTDAQGYYDATDAATSKQMRLEGLRITIQYDGGDDHVYYVGDTTAPLTADFTWNSHTAAADGAVDTGVTPPAYDQFDLDFTAANKSTYLSVSYTEGDQTQTSNRLEYHLTARPLTYHITDAEKIWDGTQAAPGRDPKTSPTVEFDADQIFVTDTSKGTDTVILGANLTAGDFTYSNSNVGDNWEISSKVPTITGAQAGFYTLTATPTAKGIGKITPRRIEKVEIKTKTPAPGLAVNTVTVQSIMNSDTVGTGNNRGLDTSKTTIKWQKWDEENSKWLDEDEWLAGNEGKFQASEKYRPIVTIQADGNHYLELDGTTTPNYKINDKINGDGAAPDDVIVTVTEGSTSNPGVFIGLPFELVVKPELRFDDKKVGGTETFGPDVGLIHPLSVSTGDKNLGSYTIDLGAYSLPVHDVKLSAPSGNLLDAGATITPAGKQNAGDMQIGDKLSTSTVPNVTTYTLDLSKVDTDNEGVYMLSIDAVGDKDKGTGDALVQAKYTFVLVVSKRQIEERPSGGGTTTIIYPVVKYWVSDDGYTDDLTAERMPKEKGAKPSFVPKITPMPGLRFLGWSEEDPTKLKEGKLPTLVDPLTFTIDEDKIFYAVYERVEVGHTHYVIGFPDGTFGPDNPITRGQVATIIARSCLEDFVEGGTYGNPGNYTDVEKHWANSAIAYCSMKGVFTGYEDGTFRPDRYITRQELATVVARLAGVVVNEGLPFSDSEEISSWALNGIYTNYVNGWVNGYTDGTFKPLNNITRAETVKIFNGYLGRGVDREGLSELREYVHTGTASNVQEGTDEYMTWPDVAKNHWAYYEVIEAANDHNFRWRDTTKAAPPEDWYEAFIDATWRYVDDANDGADSIGRDELPTFTVTYVVKSNGVTWDSVTEQVKKYESPDPAKLPKAEPSEGYRFAGWSDVDPDEGEINLVDPTASAVVEDKTFYAIFEAKLVITYVIGDHGDADREILTERINKGDSPTTTNLPKITAHEGWRFAGWSETDPATGVITLTDPTDHPAYADSTFYATYEREGEYTMPQVTVTYVLGDRGESDGTLVQTFDQYESPRVELLPQVTALEGWQFLGWSETDPASGDYVLTDPTAQSILADKSFYAVYQSQDPAPTEPKEPSTEQPAETEPPVEEPPATEPSETPTEPAESQEPSEPTESPEPTEPLPPVEEPPVEYARYHYINGYTDNTFRPDDAFTRAAVATVLANLLGYDPETDYDNGAFTDLEEHWATNAINFCVAEGLMSGYTDGTFRPDDAISRQEFAVVLTRLTGETESGDLPFTDTDAIAPWAAESVYTVYARGWISGYEDGTFLPERNVTRAEAVKMLNRYLDRPADRETIESQSGYTVWSDVPETHWAYYEIIEASNDWQE